MPFLKGLTAHVSKKIVTKKYFTIANEQSICIVYFNY